MNSRLLKAQRGSEPEVGRAGGGLGAGVAPPSAVLPSGLELSVQNPSLPGFNSYVGVLDGEGNGTPLQYSCLENPMDGRAW